MTFGLRYGFDQLRELGISAQRICLIGGGSRSPAWRQVVADVFATTVVAPVVEEGPAFGAALQAGWCVRGGSIQHLVNDSFELDPDKECHSNPANRKKIRGDLPVVLPAQ